jgi:hypothetical protein
MGVVLFLYVDDVRTSPGNTPVDLHGLLREYLYFLLYVDDISQEKLILASTACYGDSCALKKLRVLLL